MEDMRIYVASLSDYNDGRLEGKWFDLSDYPDGSDLMMAIQEMLDEITEKYNDGEVREEWAVHDYEGIPSTLASEYMGEQDFQQLYDIAIVADEFGIPLEVLMERAGDTGSDDYKALAESLMFVVQGRNEADIVMEWEDQIGELGSDFWSNHIYIDDVTERVIYGEDVDRFRDDILYENPEMDEAEAEAEAERMADAEAEMREDLTSYLDEMGYGDTIPDFVSKDYEGAWKRSMSYDYDVIYHDGEMYVFSNNYSVGGTILSGMIGAYIGYKYAESNKGKKRGRKSFGEGGGVKDKIKVRGFAPVSKEEAMLLNEDFEENFNSNIERFTKHLNKVHNSKLRVIDTQSLIDFGKKYAGGGKVTYVDANDNTKNYFYRRYDGAIGSFAWMFNQKYLEGILFPLDNFDKEYYSHLQLKSGEKLLRYSTEKMSDGSKRLIKFNLDKGLVYFMSEENDPSDDKNVRFETRGIKTQYIVLDSSKYAQGGGVHTMPDGRVMLNSAHYAGGGGVESEWVVKMQNEDSGDIETINVLAKTEDEAVENALNESGLSSDYTLYSVNKKYAQGGGISGLNDLIRG